MTRGLRGCLALMFLAVPFAVRAQERVSASIAPTALISRTNAPMSVEVTLNSSGSQMLEGALDITLREGNSVLLRYRTGDLALSPGVQTFHLMLPPLAASYDSEVAAQVAFVTKSGTLDAGRSIFNIATSNERACVICVCVPPGSSGKEDFAAWQSVRIERFKPKPANNNVQRSLLTTPVLLQAAEFPSAPLDYCAYDLVLLDGQGFGALHQKQLDALERWVEAGGSLCVLADGQLESGHVEFLNQLAGGSGDVPPFALDEQGYLKIPAASPLYHAGLGRMVVVQKQGLDFGSKEWGEAAAFLCKMRADQMPAISRDGTWAAGNGSLRVGGLSRQQQLELETGDMDYQPHEIIDNGSLARLLPETIRLIPMPVIVLILAIFVAAIGPLDYVLLGLVRRRKWTWVLFPCVSGGVTFGMLSMANHYMGASDHRNSLVFIDIGNNGKAVRETRVELLVTGRAMEVTSELRNSIALSFGQLGYMRNNFEESSAIPSRYEGQVPGHYTMSQHVPQWSPQAVRVTSLEPAETPPPFQWDKFSTARGLGGGEGVLQPGQAGKYFVWVFHGGGIASHGGPLNGATLSDACIARPRGLFQRVSQISPNAGWGMEDQPLLDASDARQWLVAVVTRRGDDIIVYRKLYYANE